MTDQAPVAPAAMESLSPEVADAFGVDQAPAKDSPEKVNSEATEDNKTDASSEEPAPDAPASPDEGDGEAPDEPKADPPKDEKKDDKAPDVFMVAGDKYETYEKAVEAVNRISGANTQMAGELIRANGQVQTLEQTVQDLSKKVQEWVEYFNDGEADKEKPKPNAASVEETVRKVLTEQKQQEEQDKLKGQFAQEIADLPKEKDYTIVLPFFIDLATKLGDNVKKISPQQLYKMARGVANDGQNSQNIEAVDKIVKDQVKKEINKGQAKKVIGGNQRSSTTINKSEVSPEVDDYFNTRV